MAGTARIEGLLPEAEPQDASAGDTARRPAAAAVPEGRRIRWDLSAGIGPEEGPFPDLGIPRGVRWILARSARLALEAPAAGPARLVLRYRSLLPRQAVRAALNGDAEMALEAIGTGLREAHELVLEVALRAGVNELGLGFTGAVREPGTGRELVLLIESAALD
jgi:hypothetical protein